MEKVEEAIIKNDRMLPIDDTDAKESKRIKSIDRFRGFCVF